MADIEKIKAMLKKRREVVYWEYLKALEDADAGIPTHARELLDELQEIDQHISAVK